MAMTTTRSDLKQKLFLKRKSPLHQTMRCELCGAQAATDLHEVWISRRQAQGNDELTQAILECEYNLALLCNPCNLRRAETALGRAFLRQKLIYQYGAGPIQDWIAKLPFRVESTRQEFLAEIQTVARRIAEHEAELAEMKAELAKSKCGPTTAAF